MANHEDLKELKAILTVCGKVSFANVVNATNVKNHIETLGYTSSMSKRFIGRLQELSSPEVATNGEELRCICCNSNKAEINRVFCKDCYAVLNQKIVEPHYKNNDVVSSSKEKVTEVKREEKPSAKTVPDNVYSVDMNAARATEIIADNWSAENSAILRLTTQILPIFSREEYVNVAETRGTRNNEINSFDVVPPITETAKPLEPKKKKHGLRKFLIGCAVFFSVVIIALVVDYYYIKQPAKLAKKVESETKINNNKAADKQTRNNTNQTPTVEHDVSNPRQNNEMNSAEYEQKMKELYGEDFFNDTVAPGQLSNNENSVDFSRYYVTETRLLKAYTEHASSVIRQSDGSPFNISLQNRVYNKEADWILWDVYDSSKSRTLGQIGLRNDERGYVKGVWILSGDHTLPRILYEIIKPDMKEAEMSSFLSKTARDDGRLYYYLDDKMYYCISYVAKDNAYITVVTRDEDYVIKHTGELNI